MPRPRVELSTESGGCMWPMRCWSSVCGIQPWYECESTTGTVQVEDTVPGVLLYLCFRAVPMSVPLVLLIVPAKLVADSIFPGIYQWQIRQAQYVFLEALDNLSSKERAAATHFKVRVVWFGWACQHFCHKVGVKTCQMERHWTICQARNEPLQHTSRYITWHGVVCLAWLNHH